MRTLIILLLIGVAFSAFAGLQSPRLTGAWDLSTYRPNDGAVSSCDIPSSLSPDRAVEAMPDNNPRPGGTLPIGRGAQGVKPNGGAVSTAPDNNG